MSENTGSERRSGVRFFSRRFFLMLLTLGLLGASIGYYFYWHMRPFTQNAFVFANTRAVTPLVPGYVAQICVRNNEFVRKGTVLFRTFRPPYELAVTCLKESILETEAKIRSVTEKIASAEAGVRKIRAELENAEYLSRQANVMYGSDAVSQTYAEERKRGREALSAALESAEYGVRSLQHEKKALLHAVGNLNAQLALAQIDLEQTEVRALSDGYVVDMSLAPGTYCEPAQVLFGFVDTTEWFVQANFTESELSLVKPGMKATIWLKQYPNHRLTGTVLADGWAAERRVKASSGLAVVEPENQWFLLPQRFPVQIRIDDPPEDLVLHPGGSAYVELNTRSYPVRQFFWELFLW